MNWTQQKTPIYLAILVVSVAAPFLLPNYQNQLAMLWVMVIIAMSWDVIGGQMGYNSFGNVVFFGVGMYVTAVTQRDMFFDIATYTEKAGGAESLLSSFDFLMGFGVGAALGAVAAVLLAALLGSAILGMRGHYFGICTLGLGLAAGEIANGIDYIGAGSGLVTPIFPDSLGSRGAFFYFYFFGVAVAAFFVLRWLYSNRFGLAINAIRDDEDKAEAMGIRTTRYKTMAWCVSGFFTALAGAGVGNLIGFIDPIDVAFAGPTFGVWMVLMAILGGKGTLWGPIIGAAVFHITQEIFWTYLLGWQRVALGALIVVIVVFFPQGIMGWMKAKWPERFGHKVEDAPTEAKEAAR